MNLIALESTKLIYSLWVAGDTLNVNHLIGTEAKAAHICPFLSLMSRISPDWEEDKYKCHEQTSSHTLENSQGSFPQKSLSDLEQQNSSWKRPFLIICF